jgi:hypothetical protein
MQHAISRPLPEPFFSFSGRYCVFARGVEGMRGAVSERKKPLDVNFLKIISFFYCLVLTIFHAASLTSELGYLLKSLTKS